MAPVGGVNIEISKLWTEVTPKVDDQSIFSPQLSRLAAWSTQKYKLAAISPAGGETYGEGK